MDLTSLTTEMDNFIETPNAIVSVVIVVIAIALLLTMRNASKRYREKVKHSDLNGTRRDKIFRSFQVIIRYGIIIIAVIAILQVNGINISALAAGLGIVGIIVAFALQDALADLAMGARIVTDNYFSLGDVIRVNDFEGEVVAFSPQSTKICNLSTDDVLTISNRNMDKVTLISRRNLVDIPVSGNVSSTEAKEIFDAVCTRLTAEHDEITYADYLGPLSFEDYWTVYRFRFYCDPKVYLLMMYEARRTAMEELEKRGQRIASAEIRIDNVAK